MAPRPPPSANDVEQTEAGVHYDLGVAYQQMGLHSDAIAEFKLAARDPARSCVCHSIIAMIHRGAGDPSGAIMALLDALKAPIKGPLDEAALLYEIADACEEVGFFPRALAYFQRLARIDAGYEDPRGAVADRIRLLMPRGKPS
jgi:tetratricopeptide (TPR) repeat protein